MAAAVRGDHTPDLAVDGVTRRDFSRFCYQSTSNEFMYSGKAWWMVDLGEPHVILNVTIYRRTVIRRLREITLLVSNSTVDGWQQCYAQEHNTILPSTVSCRTIAQYLKIEKGGSPDFNLCEVVIMGFKSIGE